MKALKYTLSENIKKALEAGCNLILHCNANYKEMLIVAKNSPKVNGFIIKKTSQFYNFFKLIFSMQNIDSNQFNVEFNKLFWTFRCSFRFSKITKS